MEKIGADPLRWMYARQNPVFNLKFGYGPAREIKRKLLTLYNVFSFFKTYVDKKEFPRKIVLEIERKSALDRWIVSRLNNLIEKVTRDLDRYKASSAILAIERFFVDDLSLWYIRRSRKRFQRKHEGRKEAIETLYYVLFNLTRIIAPVIPFIAEKMYSALKTKGMPESIHLCGWPKAEKEKINKTRDKHNKEKCP